MTDGAIVVSSDGEPMESAERFAARARREERRDVVDWLKWRASPMLRAKHGGDGLDEWMEALLRDLADEIDRGSHAR